MKNIIYKVSLMAAVILLSAGCIKETFPKGSTVTKEQLGQSDKALTYMLSGIPAAMMNSGTAGFYSTYGYHGDFGISAIHLATESMLEDIAILGELGYYWFGSYYQNVSQGPEYIWCAFFWNQYYKWIKLANEIINVVGEVNEYTSEDAKNALGQAYAYRAMFYLDLARMYEPKPNSILQPDNSILGLTVPVITEKTTEAQAKKNPRAKREDMYRFILSDLAKAEEYLEDGLNSYTSPGIAAVYGLYARAYLELGATYSDPTFPQNQTPATDVWDMDSEKAYGLAAEYARKTIDLNLHTPLTQAQWEDPKSGFNDGSANNAWIWGLTVSAENLSNLIANVAHRSCEAIYGYAVWTQIGVNQALYNRINDEDFRKHSWYDPDLDYNYQLAGSADEQDGFINGSMYNYPAKKYMSLKFRPADGNVMDYTVGNCADWCLMRIEEMYFIEMEAELGLGHSDKAKELLNEFMQEYRYESYDCTLMTMTEDAFLNEMMLQKRIEFWGEGILFFDYKRLNRGITRGYTGTNVPATATYNCEGRSPQWNIVITRGEFQSNKVVESQNNPDPTEKLTLWQ